MYSSDIRFVLNMSSPTGFRIKSVSCNSVASAKLFQLNILRHITSWGTSGLRNRVQGSRSPCGMCGRTSVNKFHHEYISHMSFSACSFRSVLVPHIHSCWDMALKRRLSSRYRAVWQRHSHSNTHNSSDVVVVNARAAVAVA